VVETADVLSAQEASTHHLTGQQLLYQLFTEQKVATFNTTLLQQLALFNTNQTEERARDLESRLQLLAYLFQISDFRKQMLADQMPSKVEEESKKVLQANNNYRLVVTYNNCFQHFLNHAGEEQAVLHRKHYVSFVAEVLAYARTD
jgi:hypothetical protein